MHINKQQRKRFTNEQKYRICMHSLQFPEKSQIELGKWTKTELNLPEAVKQKRISNILNSKDKVFSAYANGNAQAKSNVPLKMPDLDNDILNYIQAMNASSYAVNRGTMVGYAKVLANQKYKMHELPPKDRISFSDGWLTDVFKRIGVKSRHLYGENSSVDLTSENIIEELRKVKKLLEPYDPKDILNFDETGLYYEQQPTRTICEKPMGRSRKSKNRFTVGLVTNYDGSYKGHPIVIGGRKTPKAATRKPAVYQGTTSVGQSHYVEYHCTPNAWMTTEVFRKYIKRQNAAFRYADRKVALLVDNASVHKLKDEFSNIKLIFLPANTTSRLQPLDAGNLFGKSAHIYIAFIHLRIVLTGIIANFKAHFRWHQYFRATNKYLAGVHLDHAKEYRMDEVDALFYLADAWRKVEPKSIQNCWDHTKILNFKFADKETIETEHSLPRFELLIHDALVDQLNEIIPDLPGNRDDNGNLLVTAAEELDLAAGESDLIVFQPESVEFNDDNSIGGEHEKPVEEEEEEAVDVKEIRGKLKQAYETILCHSFAMDDQDRLQYHAKENKIRVK